MNKYLTLLLIVIVTSSCQLEKAKMKKNLTLPYSKEYKKAFEKRVPKNTLSLTTTYPDAETKKILSLVGSNYIANYKVEINSKLTSYIYFIATTDSVGTVDLNSIRSIGRGVFDLSIEFKKDFFIKKHTI